MLEPHPDEMMRMFVCAACERQKLMFHAARWWLSWVPVLVS